MNQEERGNRSMRSELVLRETLRARAIRLTDGLSAARAEFLLEDCPSAGLG